MAIRKSKIVSYLNHPDHPIGKYLILIKENNGRYSPLYDGDKPYYFNSEIEAKDYWDSVKENFTC